MPGDERLLAPRVIGRRPIWLSLFALARRSTCSGGASFRHLLEGAFGVAIELRNRFARVLVVDHLRKKLRRDGDDVRAGERRGLNVHDGRMLPTMILAVYSHSSSQLRTLRITIAGSLPSSATRPAKMLT